MTLLSSILKQPMALRNRAYDTNIKDVRKLRGAKAIPIELDEPDEIDLANARDLENEFMADFEFLYNDYIPPVNMMGELDSDMDDTDYGYLAYTNPKLS